MLCITRNYFYFSYGKLSPLLSIGTDGTFWKDKNWGNVWVSIYLFTCYILKEVLHTMLFLKQCYIIFETLHHLPYEYYFIFFTNCCPSEIILFLKLSRMHKLKCRNCLMFVTSNIRVLYVHWKECVRKKGNSQMCSNCNSTWFMVLGLCRYFLRF